MGTEPFDCPWCGSAKSIEHGLCQVCLMEFSVETKVITLPTRAPARTVVSLDTPETAKAE